MFSELRQDIVSGDWVVIARARARRPHDFLSQKRTLLVQPKETCPFEAHDAGALFTASAEGVSAEGGEPWWVQVVPNKFPAFAAGECPVIESHGPYRATQGTGSHEVVVTRDHDVPMAKMSASQIEPVIRAYQERFKALAADACTQYVSVFQNHGALAGATIAHPHSQIISIPVVPPDVGRSIEGSQKYFTARNKCVHCVMIRHEQDESVRLVYENEAFVVFAPFASRSAFEIRIFPKTHSARFEELPERDLPFFAGALRSALARMFQGLGDPDYNFFIHTAPVKDGEDYGHYHWHLEIVPKTAIWAGFEIGTGIEISTIAPEDAAQFLRSVEA